MPTLDLIVIHIQQTIHFPSVKHCLTRTSCTGDSGNLSPLVTYLRQVVDQLQYHDKNSWGYWCCFHFLFNRWKSFVICFIYSTPLCPLRSHQPSPMRYRKTHAFTPLWTAAGRSRTGVIIRTRSDLPFQVISHLISSYGRNPPNYVCGLAPSESCDAANDQ